MQKNLQICQAHPVLWPDGKARATPGGAAWPLFGRLRTDDGGVERHAGPARLAAILRPVQLTLVPDTVIDAAFVTG